jgi:hypothetical protein
MSSGCNGSKCGSVTSRPPGGISLCVTAPCLSRWPTRNYRLNQYVNSQDQNNPVVPPSQTLPMQEPGTRPHTS